MSHQTNDTLKDIPVYSPDQQAKGQMRLSSMLWLLQQSRGELELKMHLARQEARDEWNKLEEKWYDFQQRVDKVGNVAQDTGENSIEALNLLGQELERGYKRLKSTLFTS